MTQHELIATLATPAVIVTDIRHGTNTAAYILAELLNLAAYIPDDPDLPDHIMDFINYDHPYINGPAPDWLPEEYQADP